MTEALLKSNDVIFCEMMSHPVLFTHPHPKIVGILGDDENQIITEVIKHPELTEIHHARQQTQIAKHNDARIKQHDQSSWQELSKSSLFDVLIALTEPNSDTLHHYFNSLHHDGLLIQASASPFNPQALKSLVAQIKTAGFRDLHILNFPQPSYPTGWRTAIIALKHGVFKRLREKVIFNKSFKTHYYNFDIHRASMVLPEFMREAVI